MSTFSVKGFYSYSGFDKPELIADNLQEFLNEVEIESNYLGDVTASVKEDIYELVDWYKNKGLDVLDIEMKSLSMAELEVEELYLFHDFQKDLSDELFQYGIWMNPDEATMMSYNINRGLEPNEHISSFFNQKNKELEVEI